MSKRIGFGILSMMLILGLNGCTLAKENAGLEQVEIEGVSEDRLIGFVLTEEHLDLFDIEAFLEENAHKLTGGEENVVGTSSYEKRIYASIEKNDSKLPEEWDFLFEGVEGISFFTPTLEQENGEEFIMTVAGDEIFDAHVEHHASDEKEEIKLTGTLLKQMEAGKEMTYYANPVWQTEEGEIYLTTGLGFGTAGNITEGADITHTQEATHTRTENGKTVADISTISITLELAKKPTKIMLYQMNAAHEILKQEEFLPGEVPEEITAEKGTAYFLVETEKVGTNGATEIDRELFEPEEDSKVIFDTVYVLESGNLSKNYTTVQF